MGIGAVPAIGSTSTLTANAPSAGSVGSLTNVVTAPSASLSLASQDPHSETLRSRTAKATTSSGYHSQATMVASDASVHQSSSGSISARSMLGRSVGVPTVSAT